MTYKNDKQIEKEFDNNGDFIANDGRFLTGTETPNYVKSFIVSLRTQDRKDLCEMIEKRKTKGIEKVPEIMEKDRLYNLMNENMTIGYNQAIEDCKKIINEII